MQARPRAAGGTSLPSPQRRKGQGEGALRLHPGLPRFQVQWNPKALGINERPMGTAEQNWKQNLVEEPQRIAELLRGTKRVAVLGIKPDEEGLKPAHTIPAYLQSHGYEVIPVPVKDVPGGTILGRPVYRKVADIPGEVDVVEVFRKPEDIPQHLEDILAKRPRAVWFQLGIRNDAAAERLARAGILVVQDHCMQVEHRRLKG